MAKETTASVPKLPSVEDLQRQTGTAASVHAGAMTKAGWSPGKKVTAQEYKTAVTAFLGDSPRRKDG